MTRKELMLAVLAAAKGLAHSPVQVQKIFFIIDREIPELVGGPHFNFRADSYGPYDGAVYEALESMAAEDYVDIIPHSTWKNYRLTPIGQQIGEQMLSQLEPNAQNYIKRISEFIHTFSFTELVSAIYKAYPEMRVHGVFQGEA